MKTSLVYISAACFAFTFSSIVYYLFRLLAVFPPLTESMSLSLFIICTIITGLIFLSHQLPVENQLLIYVYEAGCVVAVVTAAGAFFGLYPFGIYYTVMTVLSALIAYGSVILLIYLNTKADEQKINQAILHRRKLDV
ncbi:hypothetical protein SporoP37_04810 [Sporosarcina sp. P37]|uniref:DUF3021 family protein n=1 Tax=unclassified Sporosarcina TaxID=2647733 RepID=UPI000A17ECF5|nr:MULTISPECIES: DUF3021 family protein [unclassified Sporosarcina]ARK24067.1 hypothetical protein SporoP37_04810 [Sporosarcina sp. P37]